MVSLLFCIADLLFNFFLSFTNKWCFYICSYSPPLLPFTIHLPLFLNLFNTPNRLLLVIGIVFSVNFKVLYWALPVSFLQADFLFTYWAGCSLNSFNLHLILDWKIQATTFSILFPSVLSSYSFLNPLRQVPSFLLLFFLNPSICGALGGCIVHAPLTHSFLPLYYPIVNIKW